MLEQSVADLRPSITTLPSKWRPSNVWPTSIFGHKLKKRTSRAYGYKESLMEEGEAAASYSPKKNKQKARVLTHVRADRSKKRVFAT